MAKGQNGENEQDLNKLLGLHPVWWALALVLLGAVGMWHLYTSLEERIIRIANENTKFPAGAIVAFQLGEDKKCPENWTEVTELRGRFIIGAEPGNDSDAAHYGVVGGSRTVVLKEENLPPHRHQVYRHAGEIIGVSSGINGAGSEDPNVTSRVRESLSGEGNGRSLPVKIMPPYWPLIFCRPSKIL